MSTYAPARYPTAMPTPCGEMAKESPKWKRSRTFHPISATWAADATRVEITG